MKLLCTPDADHCWQDSKTPRTTCRKIRSLNRSIDPSTGALQLLDSHRNDQTILLLLRLTSPVGAIKVTARLLVELAAI